MLIYTIGRSNVWVEKVLNLLDTHRIDAVLYVRSTPYSRFSPQVDRELLTAALSEAGIEYVHAGDRLGVRRAQRMACISNLAMNHPTRKWPRGHGTCKALVSW